MSNGRDLIHSISNPCYQEIKVLHDEREREHLFCLSRLKQNEPLRLFKVCESPSCSFLPFIVDGPPSSSPGILYLEVHEGQECNRGILSRRFLTQRRLFDVQQLNTVESCSSELRCISRASISTLLDCSQKMLTTKPTVSCYCHDARRSGETIFGFSYIRRENRRGEKLADDTASCKRQYPLENVTGVVRNSRVRSARLTAVVIVVVPEVNTQGEGEKWHESESQVNPTRIAHEEYRVEDEKKQGSTIRYISSISQGEVRHNGSNVNTRTRARAHSRRKEQNERAHKLYIGLYNKRNIKKRLSFGA